MAGPTGRPRRILLVHAHPDDETLTTGVTMAHHVALGDEVHVLTCTLGEEGEVIPPELAHLAVDRDDRLGPWRREELRRAMETLGVRHRVLGADEAAGVLSRYRDSGMAGTPSAERPEAFCRADVEEAAVLVRGVIDEVRPDVVITYDRDGGYGHPDHVQTHRVTRAAVADLPDPAPRLYAVITRESWAREDRRWLAEHVDPATGWTVPTEGDPFRPSVRPDDEVTHEIVDEAALNLQQAALRHHATQVTVADGYYALSNDVAARLAGREGFALLDPTTGDLQEAPVGRHTSIVGDGT